jgi:prepilin-type N-terminal cleavage/methylation domain-containing protein
MPRSPRCRRAFTLVELLIALVVFDVALLAFAADAATLVRLRARAERRDAGRTAALSRLARLRAAGCPAPVAGHATPVAGVQEYWRVQATGPATRRIRDSVAFGTPAAPASFVLQSTLAC